MLRPGGSGEPRCWRSWVVQEFFLHGCCRCPPGVLPVFPDQLGPPRYGAGVFPENPGCRCIPESPRAHRAAAACVYYLKKATKETEIMQNGYECNTFLNSGLSYDELEKVISKLYQQNGKKCFISPIPKCSKKDPFLPSNYRGISLLSCVGKLYSSILSNRIVSYTNICNILVDEQNGFRENKSCSDHIFTLSSVIQNRSHENKPIFAAFLDMEKAFDRVNRDILRLLEYGIDGKL